MAFNWIAERVRAWRLYRRTVNELMQLSDHQLADIGFRRNEISAIARHSSNSGFRPETPARTSAGLESGAAVPWALPRIGTA
jgi:uncharacterized protein YjiS (DUF1127 family)